ncbi:hypothetical protein CLV98_101191 [Dyadobacter jejuensis]|uniref:Uncharacterized protein n=2 Tax=Dyadobacter jejuensis TaxID=1082580 RepID=A0A316ARM0_9BACT|nr:hypothetical protein CLV98_101191 [Dyadobacter jejuensis]
MFSLNKTTVQQMVENREKYRKANPGYEKTLMNRVIGLSGYEKPATKVDAIFSGRDQRTGYTIEKYLVKGGGSYYLPVLWLKPSQASTKTILYLDDQGKSIAAHTGGTVEQLVRNGYEVVVPDLSGIGELGPGNIPGGDALIDGAPLNLWFMGLLVQKNLVAVRAEEIAVLSYFIKHTKTDATVLGAVASGTLTADLLHAAAIDNPFQRLVLHNPLVSYLSIAEERLYKPKFIISAVPGALPLYDLPDLVHRLSTQRLLLANPVTAADREVGPSQTEALYGRSIQKEHPENFSVMIGLRPDDWLPVLLKWLD